MENEKLSIEYICGNFGINQSQMARILGRTETTIHSRKRKKILLRLEEVHQIWKYLEKEQRKHRKFFFSIWDTYLKK